MVNGLGLLGWGVGGLEAGRLLPWVQTHVLHSFRSHVTEMPFPWLK